jgi:hypothetical protein
MDSAMRKGINPFVSTVMIIAITVVATIGIGGLVFGMFSDSNPTGQAAVNIVHLRSSSFSQGGSTYSFTCGRTNSSLAFITIINQGTGFPTKIGIIWAGSDNAYVLKGDCPQGNIFISFPGSTAIQFNPVSGQTFKGIVVLSTGQMLLFTGTWN